jgi:hypothetical protein
MLLLSWELEARRRTGVVMVNVPWVLTCSYCTNKQESLNGMGFSRSFAALSVICRAFDITAASTARRRPTAAAEAFFLPS